MRRRGFTVTELLVVLAVVAILAGVLLPVFLRMRERSAQNACMGNLRQLSQALSAYSQDYDDVNVLSYQCRLLPLRIPWLYAHLVLPYTRASTVTACPSQVFPLRAGVPSQLASSFGLNPADAPIIPVSYAINANNDDAVDPATCHKGASGRLPGYAGISRLRIIRPESRLVLMDSETNPNKVEDPNPAGMAPSTPPNGWRIFDPAPAANNPNVSIGIWLVGRHSDGTNILFADGHSKWFSVRQVINQCVQERWIADLP
ncbi:MAG: prepilin-type N-terminal cleavage/methylation domain-containing protein [Armatimonadetes bacterium]|nr:prepilin-type N-terminal cleavage/methylation domain-containing protein [Armatimonadota bacterium]MDW8122074.1 prepilin-type N-terminal cleavage/methylation domain-containing protein [Armatimonadota bacterium]